jgi:hypothetical protein
MNSNEDGKHPIHELIDTNNPWENRVFIFFLGWIGGGISALLLWTHFFTLV